MIGILLYLTTTCPEITFSVGVCACYHAKPKMSHLTKVKRIIKYIDGTCDYGIMYSHDTNYILLEYCDVDWEGNGEDRNNTSSECFFLGNNLVSWFRKKQNCVSLFIDEVEYIIVGRSCIHIL